MGWKRLACVAVYAVAFAAFAVVMYHYAMAPRIYLDDTDALDRYRHSPLYFGETAAYGWAIDYPAVYHWIDYAALKVFRVDIGYVPEVNRAEDYDYNAEHDLLAPWPPVKFLRTVNVAFLLATLLLLAAAARTATGKWYWGLLVAAPLAFSRNFGGGVGSFIFTDSYLAFFLALMILVWLRFHLSREPYAWWRVIVMGAIAGLVVSTKQNGALAALAYVAYLLAGAPRRSVWPGVSRACVFALAAFAVYVAVNPVMWQGGRTSSGLIQQTPLPVWWLHVFQDVWVRRMRAIQSQLDFYGRPTLLERLAAVFPYWYLLPVFAYVVWRARRERWFAPVAWWAGFLVVVTAFTVHIVFNRYLMPVEMALSLLVVLSAASVFESARAKTAAVSDG